METFWNSDNKYLGSIMMKIMCIWGRGVMPYPWDKLPLGDTSFELELYQSVYIHSNGNLHMCSTNMALSWHKNVERLSKLYGQKIPQTVKGDVCPTLL